MYHDYGPPFTARQYQNAAKMKEARNLRFAMEENNKNIISLKKEIRMLRKILERK